jgi:hypothetical protein
LVAVTVHVYVLAVVRLETTIGLAVPVWARVTPPLLDVQVAVYPLIEEPLFVPAVKLTVSDPVEPNVERDKAFTFVGAAGDPRITGNDAADVGPDPAAFVALTVHVYVPAVVRPGTTIGLAAPFCVPVTPPLLDVHVAVKPVIGLPPLLRGAVKVTVNGPVELVAEPDTAFTSVGAPGTVVTVKFCWTAGAGL